MTWSYIPNIDRGPYQDIISMWAYHMNYKNNITVIAYVDKLFTPTMVNSYEFSLLWFDIAIEN